MAKAVKLQPGEAELKNAKHELFCMLYAGMASKKYFGNATQCYLHVYGGEEELLTIQDEIDETFESGDPETINERRRLKSRKKQVEHSANVSGTRLLVNASVRKRAEWLLDQALSDSESDREMAYVIRQRDDLMSKVAAYREVAKVKERIRGAGALQGEFTFAWEGDEDVPKGKKKPSVKATVSVRQDNPLAEFEA